MGRERGGCAGEAGLNQCVQSPTVAPQENGVVTASQESSNKAYTVLKLSKMYRIWDNRKEVTQICWRLLRRHKSGVQGAADG